MSRTYWAQDWININTNACGTVVYMILAPEHLTKLAEAFVVTAFSSILPPTQSSFPLNPTDIDSKSLPSVFPEHAYIYIHLRIYFPEIWTHWQQLSFFKLGSEINIHGMDLNSTSSLKSNCSTEPIWIKRYTTHLHIENKHKCKPACWETFVT